MYHLPYLPLSVKPQWAKGDQIIHNGKISGGQHVCSLLVLKVSLILLNVTLIAPLTDELKEELRSLNQNNITGYEDIIKKLVLKVYKIRYEPHCPSIHTLQLVVQNCITWKQLVLVHPIADQDPWRPHFTRLAYPKVKLYLLVMSWLQMHCTVVGMTIQTYAAKGFEKYRVGHKKIKRRVLVAIGPNAECSLNSFEKLNEAGFSVYGIRDISGHDSGYTTLLCHQIAMLL